MEWTVYNFSWWMCIVFRSYNYEKNTTWDNNTTDLSGFDFFAFNNCDSFGYSHSTPEEEKIVLIQIDT